MDLANRIKAVIKEVQDFPKPGISFKDITPIFLQADLCNEITAHIVQSFPDVDAVAGIESRGFFWGMSVANRLGIPFIPVRKAGKLPRQVLSQNYELEYGSARIQVHEADLPKGGRILVHDDLLATGGTAQAAAQLIAQKAEIAGFSFLIELDFLNGRQQLLAFSQNIQSIVHYT